MTESRQRKAIDKALKAAIPWTEMIHFADTSLDFTAMVGSIKLPVQARRTPDGSPVAFASENVSLVEVLQARRRYVVGWTVCGWRI